MGEVRVVSTVPSREEGQGWGTGQGKWAVDAGEMARLPSVVSGSRQDRQPICCQEIRPDSMWTGGHLRWDAR